MAVLNNLGFDIVEALDRYYNVLSHTGYKSYCEVNNLLILSFIEELLSKCKGLITEEDYNYLSKVVECLHGSCLIPFTKYIEDGRNIENTLLYFKYKTDNIQFFPPPIPEKGCDCF